MRSTLFHLLIGMAALLGAEAHGQDSRVAKPDCSRAEASAKEIYARIREARSLANESGALEHTGEFWKIAEQGMRCTLVRKMAAELDRTGLSKRPTPALRHAVNSTSTNSLSGGGGRGATGVSGDDPAVSTSARQYPTNGTPSRSPQIFEGMTVGAVAPSHAGTGLGSLGAFGTSSTGASASGSSSVSGATGSGSAAETTVAPDASGPCTTPAYSDAQEKSERPRLREENRSADKPACREVPRALEQL